jgi:hypothetical protein
MAPSMPHSVRSTASSLTTSWEMQRTSWWSLSSWASPRWRRWGSDRCCGISGMGKVVLQ